MRRVYVGGRAHEPGKTQGLGPAQRAPTRPCARGARRATDRHRGDALVWRRAGGYLNLHNCRRDEWEPALTAAGLEYRKPYSPRHTFISECIAAGIATFKIARMAGTLGAPDREDLRAPVARRDRARPRGARCVRCKKGCLLTRSSRLLQSSREAVKTPNHATTDCLELPEDRV